MDKSVGVLLFQSYGSSYEMRAGNLNLTVSPNHLGVESITTTAILIGDGTLDPSTMSVINRELSTFNHSILIFREHLLRLMEDVYFKEYPYERVTMKINSEALNVESDIDNGRIKANLSLDPSCHYIYNKGSDTETTICFNPTFLKNLLRTSGIMRENDSFILSVHDRRSITISARHQYGTISLWLPHLD